MKKITLILGMLGASFCLLNFAISAWALTYLPDPSGNSLTYSNLPISITLDDTFSFATKVLIEDGYLPKDSTGNGKLDLLLWVGNNDVMQNVDGLIFNDPLDESKLTWVDGGVKYATGTWNATVSDLYQYLMTTYQTSIPIFGYDLNQNQPSSTSKLLYATGWVTIEDINGDVIGSWAMDTLSNGDDFSTTMYPYMGVYNQQAYVAISNFIPYDIDGDGVIEPDEHINVNLSGSGAGDYLQYSPTLDLKLYNDPGNMFYFSPYFSGLNNGFETIFLTGAFVPHDYSSVPEPSTFVSILLGLMCISYMKRRL